MKILHIAGIDKFIPSFIHILEKNFDKRIHTVITIGEIKNNAGFNNLNTINFPTTKNISAIVNIIKALNSHEKIILHGLFLKPMIMMLCLMPWLHKKCYWVVWGGDLYYHQLANKNIKYKIIELFRKFLISRVGGFITYIDGDYQKAQEWYGAKGKYYECIMYPSNIYNCGKLTTNNIDNLNISHCNKVNLLVGNSADPTNNHKEIFEKIIKLDFEKLVNRIYCPLSYGNPEYAEDIKLIGQSIFGDKFHPLMNFMPLDEYNKILDEVDIAIFAHNRQQAMGNTINLLGRGKTVFMRSDTSSYQLLTKLGLVIYDINDLVLTPQSIKVAVENNQKISNYFSENNLIKQLSNIFNS
ncbi:TDP-N-acetylfucosamine:lipid II N-acetylfucosaminyltransferase [Providencia manganoxydans]|uniref:TDP-N-acetylfucosamine:lipid II N-acetylfucosaminyltransferase n=1 Tax=Providencia manganoxydans TaxID=2923283 RepID=UPI0032DA322B